MRYEIGISIFSGDIVWVSGPYRAGRYPDLTIFWQGGLKDRLLHHKEVAVADKGYRGEEDYIDLPDEGSTMHQAMMSRACARHETCNRRFKQFAILGNRFRHSINWHRTIFHAVAVLTQINIDQGNELWNPMVVW